MDKSEDRLVRQVLAALVGSGLKAGELKAVSDAIRRDSVFSSRLASLLASVSAGLQPDQVQIDLAVDAADRADFAPGSSPADNGLSGLIYEEVQRRRLSKQRVMAAFSAVAPGIKWQAALSDLTVGEMIREFVRIASTRQTRALLEMLGMETSSDPYMGGISARRK